MTTPATTAPDNPTEASAESTSTGVAEGLAHAPAWLLDDPPPEKELVVLPDEGDADAGPTKPVFKQLKPLTLREELFVRDYCKDFDNKACAKRLNMSGPAVAGMLLRKHVRFAVHSRALQMAKSADMDQQWVLRNIREVVERCMDEDHFDASCALRGLELVGKNLAMWTDRVERQDTTVIRIESNINVAAIAPVAIDVTPTRKEIP